MRVHEMVKAMAPFAVALVLMLFVGSPALAQFQSENTSLYAWLDLNDLGGADNGNDCWGYTSASGREYALMGMSNKLVVVEITDPANPVILGNVSHTNSSWCDVKVFGDYCYVVNESGGGLDVIDLSDVDNGNITLVQRMTTGGLSSSHDVAIDTDSGYLYLLGSNLNGGRLVAYDLSDPENPLFVGQVASDVGAYVHDAQIVTFDSGPNAGKQIAFCGNGSIGLDIYDVTDKSNMVRLSRTTYSNLSYAHQCWLSEDRQLLYLNDETDGVNETVIFDVSDLSAPEVVGSVNSGVGATDHNLYVRDGFIYEAEYHAGMRIFCAEDPLKPVQVGWFDTYPPDDDAGFDGAWGVYPFFPSGTVIISDIDRGLFIVDPSAALVAGTLNFDYPEGRPALINPNGGTSVRITVEGACGAAAADGTGLLHYDSGAGFVSIPLEDVSEGVFDAVFPAVDCLQAVSYYVSMETEGGATKVDPPGAPNTTYTATVASGEVVVVQDDFESDAGWSTEILGATAGQWQRGVPINDPEWPYDPTEDGDGSGQCWLTENVNNPDYPNPANTDVDGGAVRLTSNLIDMSAGNILLSYEYYLRLTNTDGAIDRLLVEISPDGDAGPWSTIATHTTSGGLAWRHHEITPAELEAATELTATMKIRFTANDDDPQSIVEAGVDGLRVTSLLCGGPCPADFNGNGSVGAEDLAQLLGAWGDNPGHPADLDGDDDVGAFDLAMLLGAWGLCP